MVVLRKIDGEVIITDGKKDTLVSADELAERFGVSTRTIWRYKVDGMPFTKYGWLVMFRVDECIEWVKSKNKLIPAMDKVYAYLLERKETKKKQTRTKNIQEKEQADVDD